MKYLAVLGRKPLISVAELESLFSNVKLLNLDLAEFETETEPNIDRLGGTLKLARPLTEAPLDYLRNLPEGKIVLGLSDYSKKATTKTTWNEALRLKKILVRHGRSVRIVPNKSPILATATSYHNHLGKSKNRIELLKNDQNWYSVCGVQDINAYARRDQARPSRDARVGMLPPKLAQILINLCGPLPEETPLLDPFCGTGVVLQEAWLMGLTPLGSDLNPRMVDFSKNNLKWLKNSAFSKKLPKREIYISEGDATTFAWKTPIGAVACETYLGPPMSTAPSFSNLRDAKKVCRNIILSFLKNLYPQIPENTPIALAIPAWKSGNRSYSRLKILDEVKKIGYNVKRFENLEQKDLLYYREGQVVARELIVLRKK